MVSLMSLQLPTNDPYMLTVYGAIIVTGVINCFFGYRIFRFALGILLAIGGAGAGAYVAVGLNLSSEGAMIAGIVVGALIGIVLSFVFVRGAAAVAGALLGYALLSPQIGGMAEVKQWLLLLVSCGGGALVGVLLANPMIMIATAVVGAFQVVYGSWYFFGGPPILILGQDPAAGWQLLAGSQGPFIAMIALGMLGAAAQCSRSWRTRHSGK